MIFYVDSNEDITDIPDIYIMGIISKARESLLNRRNSVDMRAFVPNFKLTSDRETNKRKYLSQIKDNELCLVSVLYSMYNVMSSDDTTANVVLVRTEDDDIYGFDYLKILRKFIKKKYGIKVFKMTYDITLDMIDQSDFSDEGKDRYIRKIMKL